MHVHHPALLVATCALTALTALTALAACGDYRLTEAHEMLADGEAPGAEERVYLRSLGPMGLRLTLDAFDRAVEDGTATDDAAWNEALDHIAQQYGARHSRLFWYTDEEAARAASEGSGRPILHLRLLGNLDERLTCANSRFFRVFLYGDPETSDYLRQRFVLLWSSERPVPVVRIDFGDGRVHEQTITGNSVHYLCDADGRVLDALPGLWNAAIWRAQLEEGRELHARWRDADENERPALLRAYHDAQMARIVEEWRTERSEREGLGLVVSGPGSAFAARQEEEVQAWVARVEFRHTDTYHELGRAWGIAHAELARQWSDLLHDPLANDWIGIGSRHPDWGTWSDEVAARIGEPSPSPAPPGTFPDAWAAMSLAVSKTAIETPVLRLIEHRVGRDLAADTARNRSRVRGEILRLLTHHDGEFEEFNRLVYDFVFLTPRADEELGLHDHLFTALD